jgi:hypothetical protein
MTVVNAYGWRRVAGGVWLPPAEELAPPDERDKPEDLRPPDEDEPAPAPKQVFTKECARCPQFVESRSTYCVDCYDVIRARSDGGLTPTKAQLKAERYRTHEDRLWETLARTTAVPLPPPPPPVRWMLCEDCGCLLADDELCPSCVIPWIRAGERDSTLATYQHQPTTTPAAAEAERIAA